MSWKLKERLKQRLAGERGFVEKGCGGNVRVVLVYPNEYRVGMGNLAVHSIYATLNAFDGISCERAFLPDPADVDEYVRTNTPIMSLESQTPIHEFDVVAFTISFENDLLNVIPILKQSRIPHRVLARTAEHPLLMAGGAAITLNPNAARELFDATFVGEFEAFSVEFVEAMTADPKKAGLCDRLSKMDGVSLHPCLLSSKDSKAQRVKRRVCQSLDEVSTETSIECPEALFGDMHLIEVQRGCPRGCRFCATPSLYAPFRYRSAEKILEMVDAALPRRKKFGLVGADILSHPEFVDIATGIHARGAKLSPSSVRVDAVDEIRARILADSGHRSVALGIEAGGEALRASLNKPLSDEKILDAVRALAAAGISSLRLYFMLGLPGETPGDLDAIASLTKRIWGVVSASSAKGRGLQSVEATLSAFVPKQNTAFAAEAFCGASYFKKSCARVRSALSRDKGVRVSFDSPLTAQAESYLASAGVDCVEFLETAADEGLRKALKLIGR